MIGLASDAVFRDQDVYAQTGNPMTTSLRICNNLLRRLSKAQNTVLCGRISLFLARAVALDDRSGLNIHAKVNVDNNTPIEDTEQVLPCLGS